MSKWTIFLLIENNNFTEGHILFPRSENSDWIIYILNIFVFYYIDFQIKSIAKKAA